MAESVPAQEQSLDPAGHLQVVRNGHKPPRPALTGVGPLTVTQPRVDDRRVDDRRADGDGVRFRFTAKILPSHLRKTKAIEDPVPWQHLRRISTGEMGDALVRLGFDRDGLSAATVTRMTEVWQAEYAEWNKRDLTGKRYVYHWADGIYFGVRFTGTGRACWF